LVKIIFVPGEDNLVDNIISTVSNGKYVHVAIEILGGILEAMGEKEPGDKYPGVWLHDIHKYDEGTVWSSRTNRYS
jgi:hypothetical protein